MKYPCPECGDGSKIIDSRQRPHFRRRRRECHGCEYRWTTYEVNVDPSSLLYRGAGRGEAKALTVITQDERKLLAAARDARRMLIGGSI